MGEEYMEQMTSYEQEAVNEVVPETDFSLSMSATSTAAAASGTTSPRSSKNRKARTPRKEDGAPRLPEEKIVGYWQSAIAAERRKAAASPNRRSLANASFLGAGAKNLGGSLHLNARIEGSSVPDADEILPVAFEIARTKNLKKAVDYLIACDFLTPSPRDVAAFLRLHRTQLDASALGIFLAEGGNGGDDVEYWNQIRFNYFRPISFVGMNVEQG